ncbi:MAG TPA: hypothetical protein VLC09_04290, partial [Polyangiaceae bacterium]|nr:hypothetical protein [Polyangiaceae bacterium]
MSVNSTGPAGHRLGAWLAALAPLGAALFHAVDSPLLRSDASRAARGGGEALLQGSPSLWLGRLFEALPFGAQASRATLLGALGAGCAGLFTYLLARDATARKTAPTALEPWFALAMTWSALLGASWLDESSVVSGAAPAAALGLGLWWEVRRGLRLPLPLVGAAFGVLLAESAWVGAALALTVSFEPALRRREGYLGGLTGLLLALGACFGALMAAGDPFPWARDTAVSFGEAFPWGAAGFFAELGLLPTLAGGGALVLLLLRRWSRKWTLREPRNWALLVPILLDLTLPLAGGTGLLQTPAPTARLGLHLFALASAACLANIGLCAVSEAARGWQLYGASAARPLLAALG